MCAVITVITRIINNVIPKAIAEVTIEAPTETVAAFERRFIMAGTRSAAEEYWRHMGARIRRKATAETRKAILSPSSHS